MSEANTFDVTEFYGEKELRWYQVAARNAVATDLANGIKRILIELPTGAGKTLTIAASMSYEPIRKALGVDGDRPLRILFASHKHRLLTQAEQTFTEEANVDLISQSIFSDVPEEVLTSGWDVTILDEAHHESCNTFQYQLEKIGDRPIIGLTATPDRADGCLIKFESIINPISRQQAVEEGYLAPTFLNSIVDAAEKDKVPLTKEIIDNYGNQFGQTMMFFRTKREAREITLYLQKKGYRAIAILDQSEMELDNILNRFSDGDIQFIVNCNKINEGVDVKGCTDVYLGRTYGSYPQLNQVIGRAARPDSDCRVWEVINPLSGRNLDTTIVVGTPEQHRLISKRKGQWVEREFDYTRTQQVFTSAIGTGPLRRLA
jgi:superfamily II DNA or RNA helicase